MDNQAIKSNDVAQFLSEAKHNYVILNADGSPVCWSGSNDPVVYGGKEDYETDLQEGDTVITEYEYIMRKVEAEN